MEKRRFVLAVTLVLAAAFIASNLQSSATPSGMAGTFVRTPSNIHGGHYVGGSLEPITPGEPLNNPLAHYSCGNGVLEPGEQCEPPDSVIGQYNQVTGTGYYCNHHCEIQPLNFPPGTPLPEKPNYCSCKHRIYVEYVKVGIDNTVGSYELMPVQRRNPNAVGYNANLVANNCKRSDNKQLYTYQRSCEEIPLAIGNCIYEYRNSANIKEKIIVSCTDK